jgi:hypothetical protein
MNQSEAGFTLMETLLSVAIILIFGSLLIVSSNTAFQGTSHSVKAVNTAATITRVDRHIRDRAGAVHIPYWADARPYIDAFTAELFQSKIGPYIKSVRVISDRRRVPRGIEAVYTVNNREMQTSALFSSTAIMGAVQ